MEKIIALKEEITGLRKQAIELRDDKNVSYSNIALYIERLTANMLPVSYTHLTLPTKA